MKFQLVQATENRLLEPICKLEEFDGYSVFKSDKFPSFYGGNKIEIRAGKNVSLGEWERIFHQHFDPEISAHVRFTFEDREDLRYLIDQASAHDYGIEVCSYMICSNENHCTDLPDEFEIHHINSEEEWERFRIFSDETSRGEDWYDPEQGTNSLFEKVRETSRAVGIDWFYVSEKGSREILAKSGMFQHGDICRLQDVMTAEKWRRKGLATSLISFLIKIALSKSSGVALLADVDYVAIDLYRKLGFVDCGNSVCLEKSPGQNLKA